MNNVCLIGFDPGYGGFKAAFILPEGTARMVHIPSVVGVGDTDTGALSLGKLGARRRTPQPHKVTWDNTTYLVGAGVAAYARPVERMDFLRLSDGPELRALTYAALGELLGGPQTANCHLLIGLPVEVLANRELARTTSRALRNWLLGLHRFSLDRYELELEISQIEFMSQPAGSFFAWGMNNAGQWQRATQDLKTPVAVGDLGFNTLDLFTVENGNIVARFTGGDTVGIRRAAELLTQSVESTHDVALSLHQADDLLREAHPVLPTASGLIDLTSVAQQALAVTTGAVVAFLESRWGNGRQFPHILFTGGGAVALKGELLRHYPHGTILSEPVTANALGLARYLRFATQAARTGTK
ncbi:MAG: ParM/StbA family protein [Anaerolineae bacterium]|nr:ParM/StbA family protein [Anaerolineae bacterium]